MTITLTALSTPLHASPGQAPPFTISVDTNPENVITISGVLDLAAAPQLEEVLEGLGRPGQQHARTTLDCTALTYCGIAGLAVLVRAHRHHHASGGHLTLTPSPPRPGTSPHPGRPAALPRHRRHHTPRHIDDRHRRPTRTAHHPIPAGPPG